MKANIVSRASHSQLHCQTLKDLKKNNQNASINIFGIHTQYLPPSKLPIYKIFLLKVVDNEKRDQFDLLLVTENDNSHYTYISEFSRL